MSRNLEFYHGTNKRFAPGDLVLPPSVTGAKTVTGAEYGEDWYDELPEHREHVFVSTDPTEATAYADRAKEHFGGEALTYQVEPLKDDVVWHEYGEHSSPTGFKVVKQVK